MVPPTSLVKNVRRPVSGYNSSIGVQCDIWGYHSGVIERHVSWDVTAKPLGLREISYDDTLLRTSWFLIDG
jgi:hypothetical protein